MGNCVGCKPGDCSGTACDCGGYTPTDFCLARSSKEAIRYPEPSPVPLVEKWKAWMRSSEDKSVQVSEYEQGNVVELRERDAMLLVDLGHGSYWFPMRTTVPS